MNQINNKKYTLGTIFFFKFEIWYEVGCGKSRPLFQKIVFIYTLIVRVSLIFP